MRGGKQDSVYSIRLFFKAGTKDVTHTDRRKSQQAGGNSPLRAAESERLPTHSKKQQPRSLPVAVSLSTSLPTRNIEGNTTFQQWVRIMVLATANGALECEVQ